METGALSSPSMPIRIVDSPISLDELRSMAAEHFGDFVKGVVDLRRGLLAIGGEMHSDEEAVLLDDGSRQADLWGINLYPDQPVAEFVEFDSMINVRPGQGNRSRGVDDPVIREQIRVVVARLIIP